MRILLRRATQGVHERLHGHEGFGNIQSGLIQLSAYQDMLVRLYGFHLPFEAAVGGGRDRSGWLEDDLASVGLGHVTAGLPLCRRIPLLDTEERRLGARYVVEGSALGGRGLAQGLDPLLGVGEDVGRRFFIGRGAGTGQAWAGYLAELSAAPADRAARAEIVGAAIETFAVFEEWLTDWKDAPRG